MLNNTVTVTHTGESVDFRRVNNDNFSATYFGANPTTGDKLTLNIKHTIPPRGGSGESHMARIDIEHYEAGEYIGTSSAWLVAKSFDGPQDTSRLDSTVNALKNLLDESTQTRILSRES